MPSRCESRVNAPFRYIIDPWAPNGPCIFSQPSGLRCLRLLKQAVTDLQTVFAQSTALRSRNKPSGCPWGRWWWNYATSGKVCRFQLPSMGPDPRRPGVESTRAVDDFILELVPLTLRGKELRRGTMSTGLHSVSMVEYENVVIAEAHAGQERTGVTVTFTAETCQDQSPGK